MPFVSNFWSVFGPEIVAWWFLLEGFEFGYWFIRSRQRLGG